MLGGLLLGFFCAELFQLRGAATHSDTADVCRAKRGEDPDFSSLESLDMEFAASVVSYATLLGMLLLPLLLYLLGT